MVLLVLAIFPIMGLPAFGETTISVNFNQPEYQTGDLMEISGSVSDLSMPVIALSVYDPDGNILVANNLEIDSENNFNKIMFLDEPFFEKSGEYLVKLEYAEVTQKEYFVINNDLEPILEAIIVPEVILLTTDKAIYTHNEMITITGLVSAVESPTVLIGVYDPFGTPAGFYFGEIDSNFEFTVEFLAKAGVNFKTDGTYSVTAHYAESSETTTFDFSETLNESSKIADEPITDTTNDTDATNTTDETSTINDTDTETESTDDPKNNTSNPLNDSSENKETNQTIETPDDSIINDISDSTKNNDVDSSIIKDTVNDGNQKEKNKQKLKQPEPEEFDNLTVEDIELGKLLNQINLNCDSSTFIDTITYYDGMGPALYRLCNWEDSLNSFDTALIDDPNNAEILSNKGSSLAKMGYYYDAITQYDKALDIDPNFIPAINNKANALVNLGHTDEAIYLYAQVIQENPDYVTARKNMAIALSEQSVKDEIVEVIRPGHTENEQEIKSSLKESLKTNEPINETKEKEKPNFLEEFTKTISSLFGFLN